MPEPDVDSIRKRADAATPGPWQLSYEFGHLLVVDEKQRVVADMGPGQADPPAEEQTGNAIFIAHARTDIPALLDALATARRDRVKKLDDGGVFVDLVAPMRRERDEARATITQLRGELSRKDEALAGLLKYAEAVASGFGIIERLPAGHPIRVARAALSTVETDAVAYEVNPLPVFDDVETPPETFDNGYFTTDVEERKDES